MEIHPAETSERKNDNENVIQRLASGMREGAHKAKSLSSACIYRVPHEIRMLNPSAYTPRLIAIGPLHRNDEHLQTPMQHVKTRYMNDLLCRMTQGMENQKAEQKKILQDCVAALEKSIDDAKKCYAEEVTLDVEMMLVDGCFILELLYKLYLWNNGYRQEDPTFGNGMTIQIEQLLQDLILLENQIPLLVLEKLFQLTLARISNNPPKNFSFSDYVFLVLPTIAYSMRPATGNSTNSSKPEGKVSSPEEEDSIRTNAKYYHILHKLHDDFFPHHQAGKGGLRQVMPSASELVYAGVQFVPGTGNNLFNVNFTEPVGLFWWFRRTRFKIPTLRIVESTEVLLSNLIAFERCPGISQHFTSYAILMDMLVKSDIDVQVLEKARVVHNWLGTSKVVTDLFNKLCKGVVTTEFYFADTCNRATVYNERSQNISELKRQYFSSPLKFIGLCVAIIYFVITIAQLIVAIIK